MRGADNMLKKFNQEPVIETLSANTFSAGKTF
jgi:hypothetical protein